MIGAAAADRGLWIAVLLFATGVGGLIGRRNLIFVLLSIELMLAAAALALVAGGSRWNRPDGQVLFLFVLAVAASETAVALALVLRAWREFGALDPRRLSEMEG